MSFGYYSAPLEMNHLTAAGSPPRSRVRVEAQCSGAVSERGAFHDLGGGGGLAVDPELEGDILGLNNSQHQQTGLVPISWDPSKQVPRHPAPQVPV